MTIATAFATTHGGGVVGVLSDSRLSWPREGVHASAAVKSHELANNVIAVSAGYSVVANTAAELTRSLMSESARDRDADLWTTVRTFAFFSRLIRSELTPACNERKIDMPSNEFAIAGFYRDGSPGLATIHLGGENEKVCFFRPREERELACAVIGEPSLKDLVYKAYIDAVQGRLFQEMIDDVASVIWYLISSQATHTATIGGGLSFGLCFSGRRASWPMIDVSGQLFYRGMPVARELIPINRGDRVLRIAIDLERSSQLERQVEEIRLNGTRSSFVSDDYTCTLDELFHVSPFEYGSEPLILSGR